MFPSDMHITFRCGGGWGVVYELSNKSLQLVNISLMTRMQISTKVDLLHVYRVCRILVFVFV